MYHRLHAAAVSELRGGTPWWLIREGLAEADDPLPPKVEVIVIGAGITGALIAERLSGAGLGVAVVDRHALSDGSTAASTALLLDGLDLELGQLSRQRGPAPAVRVYRRVAAAVTELIDLADDWGDIELQRCQMLYLATARAHMSRLMNEVAARRRIGLDAQWLADDELRHHYGLRARGGILSSGAATVNPVRLARALLDRARRSGASVTTRVTVTALTAAGSGVKVTTTAGVVEARHCIAAMGYATPPGLKPRAVRLHSSYALVSEPMSAMLGPLHQTAFWEAKRPYLYARTTSDGRLMVGGADLPFRDPDHRDAALPARAAMLRRQLRCRLPALDLDVAECWSGTFAETDDGLPCLGPSPDVAGVFIALAAGGNGIPFGLIAGDLALAYCRGQSDPDADLFRVDR